MKRNEESIRQWHLRGLYAAGWDVLSTYVRCSCEPGRCPVEAELRALGVTVGDLLEALVTANPAALGIKSR